MVRRDAKVGKKTTNERINERVELLNEEIQALESKKSRLSLEIDTRFNLQGMDVYMFKLVEILLEEIFAYTSINRVMEHIVLMGLSAITDDLLPNAADKGIQGFLSLVSLFLELTQDESYPRPSRELN